MPLGPRDTIRLDPPVRLCYSKEAARAHPLPWTLDPMNARKETADLIREWRAARGGRLCPPNVRALIEAEVRRVCAAQPRGFACMDPVTLAKVSRKGGEAVQAAGTGHTFEAGAVATIEAAKKGAKAMVEGGNAKPYFDSVTGRHAAGVRWNRARAAERQKAVEALDVAPPALRSVLKPVGG